MTKMELLDAITELSEEKAVVEAKLAFLNNELDEGNYDEDAS